MTVNAAGLGDIAALATALGLLNEKGDLVTGWFVDPGGHVRDMLRSQTQREALAQFIDDALGAQTPPVTDDPARTWVPLLKLTGTADTGSDLFLVLEPNARGTVASIGIRINLTAPVSTDAMLRVPLLRVDKTSGVTFLPGLSSADQGDVSDATAELTGTVTIADATLNSVGVTAAVPLTSHNGAPNGTPTVGIVVHGLRLPGSTTPIDVSLDSASPIGPELSHLLAAIVAAEAASATGAAADLLAMLGIAPAGGAIPPLPLGSLIADPLSALEQWLTSLATDAAAIQAWVSALAGLIGASTLGAGPPYGVTLPIGTSGAQLELTVGVSTDDAGGLTITPGAAITAASGADARVAADVELAKISLGAHAAVQALPSLRLTARYGADSGTILSVTAPAVVQVGALHAGLALDASRKPVFVLGAERVDIGRDAGHLHHHDVLDLTSPDALADVGAETLDSIVASMLAGLGPAGAAIQVLLGLAPPASHSADTSWPSLSLPAFVADPIGAVGVFLREVVGRGGSAFADLLGELPGLLGLTATIAGAGSPDSPWTLELATGASLVVWQDRTPTALHAGIRAAPAIPPLGGPQGPTLGLAIVIEVLSVTLPPTTATGTPLPITLTALPDVAVEATLQAPGGQPLSFGSGYAVSLTEARLRLAWGPSGGLQVSFDLPGATATVAGVPTPLPPIALGPGGRLTLPLQLPWSLLEQVLTSALSSASAPWLQGLPDLFGAGALDQVGGVAALIADPIRFLRALLAAFLSGAEAGAFLSGLASLLAALTHGPAGTGVAGGLVTGSGTPEDPYTVAVGAGATGLEAVLWLDPAGPPVDLDALTAALGPEALGRWLDDDPGAPALDLDAVAGLIEAAAAQAAEIRALLAGRSDAGAGLRALATRIAGGDGLLPAGAQDVDGASLLTLPGVTHAQLSTAVSLATVLGAAPDPTTVVYVTGPLDPPWPGLEAQTFDLTQPGLAATAFDVSRAASQDGPWHVRLAACAACPGADAGGQLAAQAARLQQVVDAVAVRLPGQIVLVAHGSAGQAARLLASQDSAVAKLVLLGVPAAGLSLEVLDVPPAADALQLLRRLLPAPDPAQPDDADLALGRQLIGTLGSAFDSALAPVNDFLAPTALGSLTPPVFSVRGVLDADTTNRALAAVVRAGLDGRWPTASASRPAPTALRGGLRATASSPAQKAGPDAAGVAVELVASLDLGLLSLSEAGVPPPALSLTVSLSRPGGWLVGGPQGIPAAPDVSRAPSLRRATLRASGDLAGGGGLAGGGVSARIVLDEVNALTLVADQLVLGAGGDAVTPEARVLLGHLAATLGPPPAGGLLRGVVQLLEAAGLSDPSVPAPAIGLSVDAVTKLVTDPAGQLRGAISADGARAQAAGALRALFADTTSTGTQAAYTQGGVAFTVDLATPTASLRVATASPGLELPGGLTFDLDATVDAQGHWSGSAAVGPSGPPGPAGRPMLAIAAGSGSGGATVAVQIEGGLGGMPGSLSLWPLPSGSAVAGMLPLATMLFAGQLARDLLSAIRGLDQAQIDPLFGGLGLLDGSGPSAQVRLPAGLIADPGGWLLRALGTSGLDADRVAGLLDAVRELSGLPSAAHGTLPLPFGLALTAGAGVAGGVQLALDLTTTAGELSLDLNGGVTIRAGAPPLPVLSLGIGPASSAALLHVGLSGPSLTAALRLSNGNTVQLYPSGPGLGSLASAAATAALPLVLDQLEAHGPVPVPAVLLNARTVLGLGAATFDGAQLAQLATDPAGELERRLAAHGPGALAGLLPLVQPALPAGWTVDSSDPQALTLTIGTAPVQQRLMLRCILAPPSFSLGVTAGMEMAVGGVGLTGSARVGVDGSGLRLLQTTVGVDPARPLTLGPVHLAPFLELAAGAEAAGGAHGSAGIAVRAGGHVHALALTVTLGPPLSTSVGTRTDGQADGTADIGAIVTGFVIPALADVALADPSIGTVLAKPAFGSVTVGQLLQHVLLNGSAFDPGALDLAQALNRLLTLAGNIAAANPSVTIADHLRLEVAHSTSGAGGATTTYGAGVSIDPGQRVPLNSGDLVLSLEVDSTWTDIPPGASPGLSVMVLDDTGGEYNVAASPVVVVNGLGLRVSRSSGALLDTGLRIGSVAAYGLIEVSRQGVQVAGGKLELADLGVAVAGAAGGENGVAQGVLGNAAAGGAGGSGDNTPLRPQFSPSLALEMPAGGPPKWSLRAGDGDGPWWIAVQRSFGPLRIEQIGFAVEQDGSTVHGLRMLFDGGLSMLGLAIDVEDLSVGARWPQVSSDLALTDPHAWSIDLAGLAVGYSGGGVSLAGALRRRGSPPDYTGVLIAHLGPYGLTAFGGYGQFLAPDGSRYTSLFVVAGITAPLGGPPAFFVTGLGGGLGISRRLVLPATLDDFPNYPLVAALDPHSTLASDPQHALDELSAAFPPERGSFWFAAGVSFTSFALVDVTAVIAVSVGDGFQVALLGLGRMALPTTAAPLVQVELALQARFSTKEGVLIVQAQLTQNSWLLTPECRLTGGFAYASFFGTNPNAGQFVLSIGGYHPSFHHDGYPVVPRVGYIWSVASVLTISGQSYYALTSEAIMAGTRFTAALDLGFLWASLTLGIDAIVHFDPFQLVADGYASIAAGVTIDVDLGWFGHVTVSMSFHLGATVHVVGPDFHGSASIDLDVTSTTIAFGSDIDNSTRHLSWTDFSAKYLTAGGATALSGMPQAGQVTGTPSTSAGTTPTGAADKPWKLVAEWSLSVSTTAAATHLQLPAQLLAYSLSETPGIAAMANVDSLTSTLALTITGSAGGDPSPRILGPGDPGQGLRVVLVTAPLPKGVWTANPNDGAVPSGDTITAGTGFVIQAEATVEGATSEIAVDLIEPTRGRKPLPFVQETAARPAVQSDDGNAAAFAAAQTQAAQGALATALRFLTGGPLGAALSPMSVAAFGRDRVAPPKLGLLTEGIVSPQTPAPALVPIESPAPPAIDTTLHPPVLVGVLSGAPASLQRPVLRTTVATSVANLPQAAVATPAQPVGAPAPPSTIARVRAPTHAAVAARTDPAFAAKLLQSPATAQLAGSGLRAADGGPVSLRAATPSELRAGPAATAEQRGLLEGGAQALLGDGLVLRPGDLTVAELPNAARDLDATHPRPVVTVGGDAAVRVIALSVTGRVLLDETGVTLRGEIPQHAARVALWCVGGDGSPAAGLAGWTDASRLPQVGARTLLGAGALVNGVSSARRGPAAVSVATVAAAGAIGGAGFVSTRLPLSTRVVVVGLDPSGDDRELTGLTLGLDGAARARGADGRPLAPTVVAAESRTYLLYAVAPDPASATANAPVPAVEVTVGTDASWRLAGVLGGPGDVAGTAAQLAAHGAAALAAPLIRAPCGSARVAWDVPAGVS
jgi:large repetitive protein